MIRRPHLRDASRPLAIALRASAAAEPHCDWCGLAASPSDPLIAYGGSADYALRGVTLIGTRDYFHTKCGLTAEYVAYFPEQEA